VQLWDAATGTVLQTLKGHTDAVNGVRFSPDGQQLASASADGTVRLWSVATSSVVLQIFKGSTNSNKAIAFSPDGQQLASASEHQTVQLWDVTTGAPLQTFKGHTNIVAVAFSPNGQNLASTSRGGTVRLWDAATGALLQTLNTRDHIYSLSFSTDGSWLQTSSGATRIVSSLESRNLHQSIFPKNIFLRNQWIAHGENNFLWLPNDYRPWVMAVYKNTIAMGYRSGHVFILQFGF
jgi:WD40 repeat protein